MAKITTSQAVSNLRKKYNKAVKIEISIWDFNSRKEPIISFDLYIEDITNGTNKYTSMKELTQRYNELMKA